MNAWTSVRVESLDKYFLILNAFVLAASTTVHLFNYFTFHPLAGIHLQVPESFVFWVTWD